VAVRAKGKYKEQVRGLAKQLAQMQQAHVASDTRAQKMLAVQQVTDRQKSSRRAMWCREAARDQASVLPVEWVRKRAAGRGTRCMGFTCRRNPMSRSHGRRRPKLTR
jgi:hypothetical protein